VTRRQYILTPTNGIEEGCEGGTGRRSGTNDHILVSRIDDMVPGSVVLDRGSLQSSVGQYERLSGPHEVAYHDDQSYLVVAMKVIELKTE
jgi:hypothetical protein